VEEADSMKHNRKRCAARNKLVVFGLTLLETERREEEVKKRKKNSKNTTRISAKEGEQLWQQVKLPSTSLAGGRIPHAADGSCGRQLAAKAHRAGPRKGPLTVELKLGQKHG
jgi:hypothetical protein